MIATGLFSPPATPVSCTASGGKVSARALAPDAAVFLMPQPAGTAGPETPVADAFVPIPFANDPAQLTDGSGPLPAVIGPSEAEGSGETAAVDTQKKEETFPVAVDVLVSAMIAALPPAPPPMSPAPPPLSPPTVAASPADPVPGADQPPSVSAQPVGVANSATTAVVPHPVAAAIVAPPARSANPGVRAGEEPLATERIEPASVQSRDETAATPIASPPGLPAQQVATAPSLPLAGAQMPGLPRDLTVDGDGAWLVAVARDIAQAADPGRPLIFRLRPEALGELRIEMTRQDDATSLRIVTESEAARVALAEGQQRLFAEARTQGVRIVDTTLTVAEPAATDGSMSGPAQQHQDRRHNDGNRGSAAANAPLRRDAPESANHDPAGTGDRYA